MPAWINRPPRDTSVYDFELIDLPWNIVSIGKAYRCKKTGTIVTSEALPKAEGKSLFIKLGGVWKEDRTEWAINYLTVNRILGS